MRGPEPQNGLRTHLPQPSDVQLPTGCFPWGGGVGVSNGIRPIAGHLEALADGGLNWIKAGKGGGSRDPYVPCHAGPI